MSDASATNDRELRLTRLIDAPREKLFRCWTEPELLKQWFTPPPWKTIKADIDVRPGGRCTIVMQGPEGQEVVNPGVYLDVIPGSRIVLTDAYSAAWEPSEKAFMTAEIRFEDEDGKTRYTAIARHWSVEDRKTHEEMGFHVGWGIAADQLEALARRI
jgi:uncharacterized protein YndB with AHSA1/START domain